MKELIYLAEEPFYGFQGEGDTQGKHSLFIRFPGCNLRCSFCDSKFTWTDNGIAYNAETVGEMIKKTSNVVITGGEPLLPKHEGFIVDFLVDYGDKISFEIETNGTLVPNEMVLSLFKKYNVKLNISPKTNVAQDSAGLQKATYPYLLDIGYSNKIVKFLLENDEDLGYIIEEQKNHSIPSERIYIQPKGVDAKTILGIVKKYYDILIERGWNLSLRSHIIIFGNIQGV